MSDTSESKIKLTNSGNILPILATEEVVTNKGNRMLGKSGSHAVMPREERFKSEDMRNHVPGPGE
jgi:hypothetical protein